MTGLFKCLVLSCFVAVIFGLTSVRDDANWFKNGQRIKNRFVTGVVNGIVDFNCNNTENGGDVEGECLSKVECTKSGGKVGGLCSLLGSCCVIEKTCSETTSSKLSYFVPSKQLPTDCPLYVKIYSKDVCQIRLDFEKFDIEQPTHHEIKPGSPNEGYTSYQCHNDSFTVENVKNLGFLHLCGKNTNQHIYIHVAENQQQVVLRFKFSDRNGTGVNLIKPDWRIKIRQLECRKSGYEHLFNAPSKLMAMYNNLKNKKQTKSDWEWIAPFSNCLQYYPQTTGTFESFNYNGGRGCYIGQLNYAICFKKTAVCGAKYTAAGVFQMNHNEEEKDKDNNKCHPKEAANVTVSQDYIRIPEGLTSEYQYRDHYCDSDLKPNNFVLAKSFEPLYVGVHTDQFRANKQSGDDKSFEEIGFRIKYELQSGDCQNSF